jgi:nucleoside-diphosphate-sugar epimerase
VKVLITGHNGYIGTLLAPMLVEAGHDVFGIDSYFFEDCHFGASIPDIPALKLDIRDMELHNLFGYDAVINLAGLSNDPLGDMNPDCTYAINYHATMNIAHLAKQAGVQRFIHASTCSIYGASGDDFLTEDACFKPVTPYGEAKMLVERDLALLTSDNFSPTFLRSGTAYGKSPKLRGDLVINNLLGYAVTTGEILLKSDGTPWRPLVHVEDIAIAFKAALEAPRDLIHNQAFNVGITSENFMVRQLAEMVESCVPGSRIRYAEGAGPDKRNYRVNCDKIADQLPGFAPRWTAEAGIKDLAMAYIQNKTDYNELIGSKYLRVKQIKELQNTDRLSDDLYWFPEVNKAI